MSRILRSVLLAGTSVALWLTQEGTQAKAVEGESLPVPTASDLVSCSREIGRFAVTGGELRGGFRLTVGLWSGLGFELWDTVYPVNDSIPVCKGKTHARSWTSGSRASHPGG